MCLTVGMDGPTRPPSFRVTVFSINRFICRYTKFRRYFDGSMWPFGWLVPQQRAGIRCISFVCHLLQLVVLSRLAAHGFLIKDPQLVFGVLQGSKSVGKGV